MGGGSPGDGPPQPQFQCNLRKIFLRHLWRLVVPMLFGPSDGPPHGRGGIAKGGGLQRGGGYMVPEVLCCFLGVGWGVPLSEDWLMDTPEV